MSETQPARPWHLTQPDSAVVVPVPGLQPTLDRIAAQCADLVRPGIVPHISVAYPFLPRSELTPAARAMLWSVAARWPAHEIDLSEARWAHDILYTVPRPSTSLDDLAGDLDGRWPQLAAARAARHGEHAQVLGTHLALALGADQDHYYRLAGSLAAALPCRVRVDELWLLTHTTTGWQCDDAIRLPGWGFVG